MSELSNSNRNADIIEYFQSKKILMVSLLLQYLTIRHRRLLLPQYQHQNCLLYKFISTKRLLLKTAKRVCARDLQQRESSQERVMLTRSWLLHRVRAHKSMRHRDENQGAPKRVQSRPKLLLQYAFSKQVKNIVLASY